MTIVVLAEDDEELYKRYIAQLKCAEFEVLHARTSMDLMDLVLEHNPEIIVSDTELGIVDYGDQTCGFLLEKGLIDNTLLIAMSSVSDYDGEWKGIAHDFLHKRGITDLGKAVRFRYEEFKKNPNMPRYKVFPKT